MSVYIRDLLNMIFCPCLLSVTNVSSLRPHITVVEIRLDVFFYSSLIISLFLTEHFSDEAKVGVTLGTFFVALLFMILLVGSGKIAEKCCKQRTIVRKEGRYDTAGDGFDNPIYGTAASDFTLMYSPQGGVQMVDTKINMDKNIKVSPPKLRIYANEDSVDGGHVNDGNDIYMDMGVLARKPEAKKKAKRAVPNPLYEAEHPFPSLAQQSSVELYIDHEALDHEAMGNSGLPGMSNMAMLGDLKYREEKLEVPDAIETKSDAKDSPSIASDSGLPSSVPFQDIDYGTDATDEYVSPTSPIFDGLRKYLAQDDDSTEIIPDAPNGFSSVDLIAPPQELENATGTDYETTDRVNNVKDSHVPMDNTANESTTTRNEKGQCLFIT